MRKSLVERLTRLETRRDHLRSKDAGPIDSFEAERIYRDVMLRASTAAPMLPADPHEAAKAYMDFVSDR
jgi:hypothetical protein